MYTHAYTHTQTHTHKHTHTHTHTGTHTCADIHAHIHTLKRSLPQEVRKQIPLAPSTGKFYILWNLGLNFSFNLNPTFGMYIEHLK